MVFSKKQYMLFGGSYVVDYYSPWKANNLDHYVEKVQLRQNLRNTLELSHIKVGKIISLRMWKSCKLERHNTLLSYRDTTQGSVVYFFPPPLALPWFTGLDRSEPNAPHKIPLNFW